MKTFFKLKIKCYKAIDEMNELQKGIRPDCIIYTGPAAIYPVKYGIRFKKWHKCISKVIGKFEAEIPNDLHCIIYIKCNFSHFQTTHSVGTENEHSVFHEDMFIKSLNNFKEFVLPAHEHGAKI